MFNRLDPRIVTQIVRVITNLNLAVGDKADGLQFDDLHGEIITIQEFQPLLCFSVFPVLQLLGQDYRSQPDMPALEMIAIMRVA